MFFTQKQNIAVAYPSPLRNPHMQYIMIAYPHKKAKISNTK